MVMERKRPEFVGDVIAGEEGTDPFFSSAMCTFNRTILVTSVSTRRMDTVAMTLKETTDMWVIVEFTALIHVHILIGKRRVIGAVLGKEVAKPLKRNGFGCETFTDDKTSVMIFDEDPIFLAFDAEKFD